MTKTNSFSLFWDHDKVGTYEVKKTETNMHRQHTGSVGLLAPGSTATEKYVLSRHPITVTMATLPCLLLKWVLRSDYKHLICDLFHHRMYKLCLKMAFMHLLQLYLFKYLPLSISVHMTQAYWTFMHATCVHPLSCDAHWPLQIIWKWYYWLPVQLFVNANIYNLYQPITWPQLSAFLLRHSDSRSEFGVNNMKAWIHPALCQRFRLVLVV